jgi:hypothetical protein
MTARWTSTVLGMLIAAGVPVAAGQPANGQIDDARKLAGSMVQALGSKLQAAMKEGGPGAAIGVCTTAAPSIASELSRQGGVRVTRVSLKVRNPLLGTPDAWEQGVLQSFDARLAKGEAPDKLEFAERVVEPTGTYLRYMKALPVQAVCLNCHGDTANFAPDIRERLARDYPADRATGYSMGQIRGAVSVKRPL